ncbi:MAG: 16S rRNA (cytosine(1402)-N(4))-methyltransferase RsmH, partial [Candidatus Peregrinibacteria bacterium]
TGEVDAIFFDLGLSSPHLDEGERGFSFQNEGPLDMRFDKRGKLTAYEVVNGYSEEELMKIFFKYGEEKYSRKIAGRIVERRKEKLFETTTELAEFIKGVVKEGKTHPATQVFQAIRIEVNDELGALKEGLEGAMSRLRAGGRLVVISYHSLEDRIVKQFMRGLEKPEASEDEKIYKNFGDPLVKILTKKPVIPTEEEISSNPRSRSAKLRALKKL